MMQIRTTKHITLSPRLSKMQVPMKPLSKIAILILFAFQVFASVAAMADDGANRRVANIQRTLARMAASTSENPTIVRR